MKKENIYFAILLSLYLTSLFIHIYALSFTSVFSEVYFVVLFLLYSDLPYYFCFLIFFCFSLNVLIMFGLIMSWLIDLYSMYIVLLDPQNATSGLNLITAPLIGLIIIMFFFLFEKIYNYSGND